MKSLVFAALLGSAALLPVAGTAQPRGAGAGTHACDRLVTFLRHHRPAAKTPPRVAQVIVTPRQARTYRRTGNEAACREAIRNFRDAGMWPRNARKARRSR